MGRFRRSFRIGVPITAETVQATWREGVLEIVLEQDATASRCRCG